MPLKVSLNATQLKASKIVDPDWHAVKIVRVSRDKSKSGDSFNYVLRYVGLEGDAKDVPFTEYISEKDSQIGRLGRIAVALNMAKPEDLESDTGLENLDLEEFEGAKLQVRIKTGEFAGQPKNEIVGHRPLQ